jgi:hypothetical protein
LATDDGAPVYIRDYLAPLVGMLALRDITNIYVYRPGEWKETELSREQPDQTAPVLPLGSWP